MEALLEPKLTTQDNELQLVTEQKHTESKSIANKRVAANSLKNLKPRFVKGVSGNPSGRPKSIWLIRDLVLEDFTKRPKEALAKLYDERIDLYFAYAFGKPADRVELSGPDGGAIEVQQTSQQLIAIELSKRGVMLPGVDKPQ